MLIDYSQDFNNWKGDIVNKIIKRELENDPNNKYSKFDWDYLRID